MLPSPDLASPPWADSSQQRVEAQAEAAVAGKAPPDAAPLAPHTARSSRALCARRPSAGGWSCECTRCPTQGRCPTRSGLACPQGRGLRDSPRTPPESPGCGMVPVPLPCQLSRSPIWCPHTFKLGHRPFLGSCFFPWRAGLAPMSMALGALPGVSFAPGQGASWCLRLGPASSPGGGQGSVGTGRLQGDVGLFFSVPPAPSSSCRRRTCRAT